MSALQAVVGHPQHGQARVLAVAAHLVVEGDVLASLGDSGRNGARPRRCYQDGWPQRTAGTAQDHDRWIEYWSGIL